jgi:hypothetical protein
MFVPWYHTEPKARVLYNPSFMCLDSTQSPFTKGKSPL